MEPAKIYIVTHSWKYGECTNIVKSTSEPTEAEIVEALDIDFAPDRDEYITISEVLGEPFDLDKWRKEREA